MPQASHSPLTVLLIEDQSSILEVVASMLTHLGHQVVRASGGREGLARLEGGERVDLVLTDLMMPDMNGRDVVRAVKERWPHLPVGLMTRTPDALTEGHPQVDFVIAKPVSLDALRQVTGIRPRRRRRLRELTWKGAPAWPPDWWGSYAQAGTAPEGAVGILRGVRLTPDQKWVVLTIEHEGSEYVGILRWDGLPAAATVVERLKAWIGRPSRELGDIEP